MDPLQVAKRVAKQWSAWLIDPEHNAPPNPKANGKALRAYKAQHGLNLETTDARHRRQPGWFEDGSSSHKYKVEPLSPQEWRSQAVREALTALTEERKNDQRPPWRDDPVGFAHWARREDSRQRRELILKFDL